jgi:hypothetical protein
MATGTPGRRYWVELYDVQTFHARRLAVDVRSAPAVALELGNRPLRDVVRAELVALLVELRAERGAGVGLRMLPTARVALGELELASVFREAVKLAGLHSWEGYLFQPHGVLTSSELPIAVDACVLGSSGELVGTTCQAAR